MLPICPALPVFACRLGPEPISSPTPSTSRFAHSCDDLRRFPRPFIGPWIAALAALLIPGAAAFAQSTFGTLAVGSSATQTVTVAAKHAGAVSAVQVLTMGTAGLDYQAAVGGTCASANLAVSQQCTQPVTFTPAAPGQRLGAVVLLDSSSNVIGTTYLLGTGSGGLAVLIPANEITYAGSGAWDLVNDGQLATSGDLNQPSSVALDGAGNVYIADSAHNRIRKVDVKTQIISTFVGNGNTGFPPDGTPANNAALSSPSGVAIDGAGNLYIADTANNAVREVSAATGLIFTIAGTGTAGYTGDGGPATSATLNQPWGVTVDPVGNVYIADTNNHTIRRVDVATGVITTVAGTGFMTATGAGDYSGDGGPAINARLNRPFAVAFDAAGNMYIPDSDNNRVRAVNTSGIISTFAGNGTNGLSGDGGLATAAELWAPSGVLVDTAQNVYIADSQNNAIRKVYPSNGNIFTVLHDGVGASLYNQVLIGNSLYGPIGLALDGLGNIYIADYFFMRVRLLQANVATLDFTSKPTRQGDVSAPQNQLLENDGNAPLSLSSITPDANSLLTPSTTCAIASPLSVNSTCVFGVEFAPTVAANPLLADIVVTGQTVDSPLNINVVGNATPVNSTTVALTANPNPSAFGQSVTFTATVTTGANTGALTGTLTFFDGATKLQAGVPVNASGVGSFPISTLAVGVHSITAAYSGDTQHYASTSPVLSQVVNERTATTLASSANPSALGSAVTFTATVSISNGGGVTPDGTVTFLDGSAVLATVPLTPAGTAAYTTSTLIDGLHSISATYSGDPAINVLGSSSAALSQDVLAASAVVVASGTNPSNYGSPVTFTATVTSTGSVAPTGVVNFLDGGAQIGTANLVGTTGVTTFTTSSLSAGSHAITAIYKGSANDGPGTSAPIIQVVSLTQTSTTLAAAPNPGIAGKPVVLSAKVMVVAGAATVTGTVTFTDGTTVLGSAPLDNTGTATLSQVLAPGAHAIVASYGGDANDNPSTSAALPVNVILATTNVALTSSGSPLLVLSSITFTATVAGNGGIPTGTVNFSVDGTSAGSGVLDAKGIATFTDAALPVGTHAITASYSGDANNNPSTSSPFSQVVQPIPTVTDLGASSTNAAVPQAILVATTLASTGPTPTGTITFSYAGGATIIGAAPLDASGVATIIPNLPVGNYSVLAAYSGDALHSASTSAAIPITGVATGFAISVNPPTLNLVSSQNGNVTVNIVSNNNFSDSIGMGCLSLPAAVNCHFASNTVNLKPGQTASVQLTIDTNAPLSGGTVARARTPGTGSLSLAGIYLPLGLFLGVSLMRFRRRNAAFFVATLALFLAGALALTGCGAGFSQITAAPGTYTIQIGGVGTTSNISHYQNLTLTVTK